MLLRSRALLIAGLVATISHSALAEDGEVAEFASICVEDASVGFNWDQGDWRQVNFKTDTFVVRKLGGAALEKATKGGLCVEYMKPQERPVAAGDELKSVYECYSTSRVGAEPREGWCRELYSLEAGKWVLWNIDCTQDKFSTTEPIAFLPNGGFIRHLVGGNVESNPKNDYKDSLSLSVGKCSVIE